MKLLNALFALIRRILRKFKGKFEADLKQNFNQSLEVLPDAEEEPRNHCFETRHPHRYRHRDESFQTKTASIFLEEKCPKCGRVLVERSGSYGEFMGCSGFPECRFTKGQSHLPKLGDRDLEYYPKLGGRSREMKLGGHRSKGKEFYPKMCRAKRSRGFPKL